jgi:hypothetical protein
MKPAAGYALRSAIFRCAPRQRKMAALFKQNAFLFMGKKNRKFST